MIESNYTALSNDDLSNLVDMEFEPMLYGGKNELPPDLWSYDVILQSETLFNDHRRYHSLELPAFYVIITFTTTAAAIRAGNDGLDLGQTQVMIYDANNHLTWLAHLI